jgi:quercetin dioxygenase-like cupin family protein
MTRTVKLLVSSAVLIVGATVLVGSQPAGDALDALKVAPDSHKLAFENAFVRVLDVHVAPGKTEPRHRHPHGMSVYFTDWDAKVTVEGGEPQVHHRKAGTFAWSDAVIHTVQNVGSSEGHILRIELKY